MSRNGRLENNMTIGEKEGSTKKEKVACCVGKEDSARTFGAKKSAAGARAMRR